MKLQRNYHVRVEDHNYSVPFQYIGRELTVYWDAQYVDIYCGGDWICSHEKSIYKNGYTTVDEHMPEKHKAYKRENGMNAAAYIDCAKKIGPNTEWLVKSMLGRARHPQQAYRGCAGVLSLARTYGNERVETACNIIRVSNLHPDYSTLKSILLNDIDKKPGVISPVPNDRPPINTNVRGKAAFASIPSLPSKKRQ